MKVFVWEQVGGFCSGLLILAEDVGKAMDAVAASGAPTPHVPPDYVWDINGDHDELVLDFGYETK